MGKPGVLQSMGSQRVGDDLVTAQQHSSCFKSSVATPPPCIFQSKEQAPDSGEGKTRRNRWRLGSARNKDPFDFGWLRRAVASVPG